MALDGVVNPAYVSANDMLGALTQIGRDLGYVLPIDAMMPMACYLRENEISIEWDSERKVVKMRTMHSPEEEAVSLIDLAKKALDYTTNHCRKDNPRCEDGVEDFIRHPTHPIPIDPTDFQKDLNEHMEDMTISDDPADLMAHAALMMGQSTGAIHNLVMEFYEGKDGVSYKELMDILAEILLSYVRLLSVFHINMTEIMIYVLSMLSHRE